jgi:Zn-dependent protease
LSAADILYTASVWILPALLAITFHEAAHGWVAWQRGDDTAYRLGRVTFNPLRHVDSFGTVVLPAMLLLASGGRMMFGYAKPVPVDFGRLRRPRQDMVLVAAAGPAANFILAFAAAFLLLTLPMVPEQFRDWIGINLLNALWINVLLAVFNLLPLPPLDGGRVAVGLLPLPLSRRLARVERYGFLIVLGAVFLLPLIGAQFGYDLDVFGWLVVMPASWISELILRMVGVQ